MDQQVFEWLLIVVRWVHITVGVTWIGTSIFFMWLDRTFVKIPESETPGHLGELWMVHGGGFYRVEKLQMGPTKVPSILHWFKWESYWTWISGMILIGMIFYTGSGTFLLDSQVSDIDFGTAIGLAIFSVFGSWFFYDQLWERKLTKDYPLVGHAFTIVWFIMMTYILCHYLSGRAAYIHVGAMLGTWMAGNVFMRIIPRQLKMVKASEKGEPVNQDWSKNAKARSTHNTYFTLPIIFIMLSNHFASLYGHEFNWVLLIAISAGGAAVREFFVKREHNPRWAYGFLIFAVFVFLSLVTFSVVESEISEVTSAKEEKTPQTQKSGELNVYGKSTIKGVVNFKGEVPQSQKLSLPTACAEQFDGDVYLDDIKVKNGKLENVLVHISRGLEGKVYDDTPTEEVEIDQVGCIYIPRVVGVRVRQPVTYINSDPIYHNIRAVTKKNRRFNKNMPYKDQRITVKFKKPELALVTKCDVHPWMGVFVNIFDHPFFDVSQEDGTFEIKNLPRGKYTLTLVHEFYGAKSQEIEVDGESDLNLDFTYSPEDKK